MSERSALDWAPRHASRRWLLIAAGLVAAFLMSLVPQTQTEAASTPYRTRSFSFADICADGLSWTSEKVQGFPALAPRDKHGVPMVRRGGKLHYRPGALAINGMKRIDAWRHNGDDRQLAQALKQARRLRIMARDKRNAWFLPFTYDYAGASQVAPWYNAMTQGLVLSFFVRLYDVTGDRRHFDAAKEVFRSFKRLGMGKPWVAYVDSNRYLWLEHYPLRRPDHVLNAHMHAIFGIYEYGQVSRSEAARKVLRGAVTTMRDNAWRYRRKGKTSLYGLRIRSSIYKYHEIHMWQLRLLARITGDRFFRNVASAMGRDRPLVGYVAGRPAIRDRSIVGHHCRPARPVPPDPTPPPGEPPVPGPGT